MSMKKRRFVGFVFTRIRILCVCVSIWKNWPMPKRHCFVTLLSYTNYIQSVSQPTSQAKFKFTYLSAGAAETTATMQPSCHSIETSYTFDINPMGNTVFTQGLSFLWCGELLEPKQANNKTKYIWMKGVYANSGGSHRQNNNIRNSDHDLNELGVNWRMHADRVWNRLLAKRAVRGEGLLQFCWSMGSLTGKCLRWLVRKSKRFRAPVVLFF